LFPIFNSLIKKALTEKA